jgi:hypothetical protein
LAISASGAISGITLDGADNRRAAALTLELRPFLGACGGRQAVEIGVGALLAAEQGAPVPDGRQRVAALEAVGRLLFLEIEPLDGGPDGGGENDNTAMMFFLKDRVELLRDAVNPDAGVVLAHHTRKASKHQVKDDPFLALSGASALCGFYTSGLLMHRPEEDSSVRRLEIELRNGPALPGKLIDKVKGEWVELNPMNERLVRKEVGAKLDAERLRKHDVILGMLLDEAASERLYTAMQFAETFENRGGLGSKHTIRERLSVLATKGLVKFLRDPSGFGFPVTRSRFGYLCVEGMQFGAAVEEIDPATGEVTTEVRPVLPSHFKCPQSGLCLQVENPAVWVYPEGLDDDLTHMSEA